MMITIDVSVKFTHNEVQLIIDTGFDAFVKEFPFGEYNNPYEIGWAVVEAVKEYAIEMGGFMPTDMENNLRKVFEETEYDTVEKLILYNKPVEIIH